MAPPHFAEEETASARGPFPTPRVGGLPQVLGRTLWIRYNGRFHIMFSFFFPEGTWKILGSFFSGCLDDSLLFDENSSVQSQQRGNHQSPSVAPSINRSLAKEGYCMALFATKIDLSSWSAG